jgi:hypothetical protein
MSDDSLATDVVLEEDASQLQSFLTKRLADALLG